MPSRRPVSPANERASEQTNERASERTSSPRALLSRNNNKTDRSRGFAYERNFRQRALCIAVLIRRDTRALVRPRQFRATRATKIRLVSLVRTDQSRRSYSFPFSSRSLSLSLFPFFFLFLSTLAVHMRDRVRTIVCDRYGRKSSAGEISSDRRNQAEEKTTTLSRASVSKETSEQGKRRREEVQGPWVLALSKTASD